MCNKLMKIILVLLFVLVAGNAFAAKKTVTSKQPESVGRKSVSLDAISGDTTRLNGFSVFPNYVDGCYSMALAADMNTLNKDFLKLLEGYDNEYKYFYIATTAFGLEFVSKFKIDSKKDICFMYVSKGETQFPRHVIRIASKEIAKLNNRDFGKADGELVKNLNAMPYDTPPYPLIEIFKNASIYQIEFPKEGQRRLEKDQPTTERYNQFLKDFQFPGGSVSESSVEDVYANYLNMGKEVYQCILASDLQCVKNFKKMGFDLNTATSGNEPILMFSIRKNKSEITNFLLKSGANPNVVDSNSATPLMLSVVKQDLNTSKLLVKYGADPNKRTVNGVLALDIAKINKIKSITEYLATITTAISHETTSKGNKSNCFMIRDQDTMNGCLAQFDGRDACFRIRSQDEMNACLAQFDGKDVCFRIRNQDEMNACLARFDGKDVCFRIRNQDEMNACLAQFDGKDVCFRIRNQDEMNACLAQF